MALSATRVDLGAVGCGTADSGSSLTITNLRPTALSIAATTTGATFSVSPALLRINGLGSSSLQVFTSVPASATAGVPIVGALGLSTTSPGDIADRRAALGHADRGDAGFRARKYDPRIPPDRSGRAGAAWARARQRREWVGELRAGSPLRPALHARLRCGGGARGRGELAGDGDVHRDRHDSRLRELGDHDDRRDLRDESRPAHVLGWGNHGSNNGMAGDGATWGRQHAAARRRRDSLSSSRTRASSMPMSRR